MRHHLSILATLCGLASAAAALPSLAAVTQQYEVGAAMACRPALPAFDGAIRTRPLAMANEGSSNAFITCSNWSAMQAGNNYNSVLGFTNRGGASATVSCTLVAGGGGLGGTPVYFPATIVVTAGGTNYMLWGVPGTANLPSTLRYSCSLPPGVELGPLTWGQII